MKMIEKNHSILRIGKTGENAFRTFSFDVSDWVAEYPRGEITGVYRRPDDAVYPVKIHVKKGTAHWTVNATDLAIAGSGELELRITDGDVIEKSMRFPCIVSEALCAGEEPPAPARDWITEVMHDAREAAEAATMAKNELTAAAERGDFDGDAGPQGPQGPKGDKGDKGDPGEDGKNGKDYILTDEDKAEIAAAAADLVEVPASPKDYGAIGLGATDDTAAFKQALAENRIVRVPGGRYVLSDTLVIRENCCLELSQDTVLEFVSEEKNAITLLRAAHLKGNHATITVPYTFSANVIHCDTGEDEAALGVDATDDEAMKAANNTAVPPFVKWDPQWKMTRYVTDVNICKPDDRGFHYAKDGDCYGTAISLHCDAADYVSYMWGVSMSGVRIAGGFAYGIRAHNIGDAWNHDMRIEALIDACKVGVSMENCHYARLAVTIQPRRAYSDSEVYKPYAEHGILLKDCRGIDLSGSRVWDWNAETTLWAEGNYYQHIALLGECRGLILDDFLYHEQPSIDIRRLIYTDTPSNLENMTILQEPIDRWFKTKNGEAYFHDGYRDRKLVSQEEMDAHFGTDFVKGFTDVLASAEDTDGTILNGVGYKIGARLHESGTVTESPYYGYTGFIPCAKGSTIYAQDLTFDVGDQFCKVIFYDADKNFVRHINRSNIVGGSQYYAAYRSTEGGFALTVNSISDNNDVAYARFTFYKTAFGENPMMAVDEEIQYTVEGYLADNVKVKAKNVIGLPDGGSGAQSDWSAAEGEPGHVLSRTHYEDADGTVHKLDNKFIDAEWMATMVAEGEEEEILPERTISFTSKAAMVAGDSYKLLEGSRYTVYWNGTAYACTAALASSGDMVLGNGYYHMTTMQNTGEPFCFTESGGSGYVKKSTATAETFTVRIVKLPDLVPNKLPAEFLPDGIGGNANIDVTAEVGQTIVVKAVDENGKPTAWESADYQERTHWTFSGGGLVLDGQTVTFGSDGMGAISGTLDIEAGKTYTVIWDGEEYFCDCMTGYYSGMAIVYIGNPAVVGLDNNGLPFVIGKVLANGYTMAASLIPNTTHSLAILSTIVNKVPGRYMGDNEFVLHFEGEPDNEGELTVKETAQEILAAIKAGKKFVCEHYSMYMGMESKSKSSACGVFTFSSDDGTLFDVLCGPANFGVSSAVDTVSVIAVEIMENAQGLVEYMRIMATRYYNDKIIYHDEKSST